MEVFKAFASLTMLVLLIFDLFIKRSFSLWFVLIASPYLSGLVMYFSIFRRVLTVKGVIFHLSKSYTLLFGLLLAVLLVSYFDKPMSVKTILQLVQFILILVVVIFVILSAKSFIYKPMRLLDSLLLATVFICIIKISAVALGVNQFNFNGQNEDSFLIVLIGVSSGFIKFQKIRFLSFCYFSVLFLALYFYESRSAQALAFFSLAIYLGSALLRYRFKRMMFFGGIVFSILVMVFGSSDIVQSYLAGITDLERSHSNLERFSMYLYTYNFLLSGGELYGLGNVTSAMGDMKTAGAVVMDYPHPHSTYLRFSLELGWAGIIGLLSFYFWVLIKTRSIYLINKRLGVIWLIMSINLIIFSFVGCIFFSFFRASGILLMLSLVLCFAYLDRDKMLKRCGNTTLLLEAK